MSNPGPEIELGPLNDRANGSAHADAPPPNTTRPAHRAALFERRHIQFLVLCTFCHCDLLNQISNVQPSRLAQEYCTILDPA
jgi:hypothetical protein